MCCPQGAVPGRVSTRTARRTRRHLLNVQCFFIGCEGLIDGEACPREGSHRTGINPACYAYEVRSSGLIGFADFVGVAQTFYVGAVIGRGDCLGVRGAD
jgi:hypothetical protein